MASRQIWSSGVASMSAATGSWRWAKRARSSSRPPSPRKLAGRGVPADPAAAQGQHAEHDVTAPRLAGDPVPVGPGRRLARCPATRRLGSRGAGSAPKTWLRTVERRPSAAITAEAALLAAVVEAHEHRDPAAARRPCTPGRCGRSPAGQRLEQQRLELATVHADGRPAEAGGHVVEPCTGPGSCRRPAAGPASSQGPVSEPHGVADAQPIEHREGSGPQPEPGPDLVELRRPLVDLAGDPVVEEAERGGEPADASTHDPDRLVRHVAPPLDLARRSSPNRAVTARASPCLFPVVPPPPPGTAVPPRLRP